MSVDTTRRQTAFHARQGFTLLEMLVVIAVITLLVALLMPAASAVRRSARRQKVHADEVAICTAVKGFRDLYGHFPQQTQGLVDKTYKDGTGGTELQGNFWMALLATSEPLNPRKVPFLDPNNDGPETCPVGGCWLDPWGEHYIIAMDENADGKVELTCGSLSTTLVGVVVAVACTNADPPVYSWE